MGRRSEDRRGGARGERPDAGRRVAPVQDRDHRGGAHQTQRGGQPVGDRELASGPRVRAPQPRLTAVDRPCVRGHGGVDRLHVLKEVGHMFSSSRRGFLIGMPVVAAGLSATPATAEVAPEPENGGSSAVRNVVLAVHGGAGSLPRGSITPEQERAYRGALETAVRTGFAAINAGKPSLDAAEMAVRLLEDDPNFNAGKGAVFNTDGEQELDASIMNGKDLRSGAVAGVHNTKNPVTLARMVMERSPHVLMAGKGADIFALRNGVAYTTQDYFFTQRRWDALIAAKGRQPSTTMADAGGKGTVGAVAVNLDNDLAAATSTGGLTNKLV